MRTYEIYSLDTPSSVSSIQQANTPEEALTKEAALDPSCIVDTALLTLINQRGAHGAREKGGNQP